MVISLPLLVTRVRRNRASTQGPDACSVMTNAAFLCVESPYDHRTSESLLYRQCGVN